MKLLFISRLPPMSVTGGSASHIADFIGSLLDAGFEIAYFCLFDYPPQPYLKGCTTIFLNNGGFPNENCVLDIYCDGDLSQKLTVEVAGLSNWGARAQAVEWDTISPESEKLAAKAAVESLDPDAVIVDYEWLAPLFDNLDAKFIKVIFLHDLRTRILPSMSKCGIPVSDRWNEEIERKLISKAEVILSLDSEDSRHCRRIAPSIRVLEIGISNRGVHALKTKGVPGRLLYIASDAPENLFAINEFISRVWPRIKFCCPHVTLMICGTISNSFVSDDARVLVLGFVEDLEKVYTEAEVVIAPHRMVGGLKIKVAEAISYGRAVVASDEATSGLKSVLGSGVIACSTAEKMSHAVISLLGKRCLVERQQFLARLYSKSLMVESRPYLQFIHYLRFRDRWNLSYFIAICKIAVIKIILAAAGRFLGLIR